MKILLPSILFIFFLSSCSKDNVDPEAGIIGKWHGMLNCTNDYDVGCDIWENTAWEFDIVGVSGDSLLIENFKIRRYNCEANPEYCEGLVEWNGVIGSRYIGDSVFIRVDSYGTSYEDHVFKGVHKENKMEGELLGMYGYNEKYSWIFSDNQSFEKQ